jgi:hypothetical protein
MITLTSLQRDFLDRFYTENQKIEPGYAFALARQCGFSYEHFMRLWRAYCRSWGNDFSVWGDLYPPLSPAPDPPIFPWASVQKLEQQLEEDEAEHAANQDRARTAPARLEARPEIMPAGSGS